MLSAWRAGLGVAGRMLALEFGCAGVWIWTRVPARGPPVRLSVATGSPLPLVQSGDPCRFLVSAARAAR